MLKTGMRGSLPSGVQGLPISSVSEPLLLSIFATAGEDLRAEAAAKVQRGAAAAVLIHRGSHVRARLQQHPDAVRVASTRGEDERGRSALVCLRDRRTRLE